MRKQKKENSELKIHNQQFRCFGTDLKYIYRQDDRYTQKIKMSPIHKYRSFLKLTMPFLKHDPKVDERCYYTPEQVEMVQWVYIASFVFWIFIICTFKLWDTDFFGWVILAIPLVIFCSGYVNADRITIEVEKENFQANYLTIGLMVIIPLLTWVKKGYKGDTNYYIRILFFAIIIILFSLLDVWVERKYLSVVNHVKSVFQTLAIVLIIYALYSFYIDDPNSLFE